MYKRLCDPPIVIEENVLSYPVPKNTFNQLH